MTHSTHSTVILGGGFVGLFTALHLQQQNYPYPIILIDQTERFIFKPLLYEFFSGEMNDLQVCPRYDELLDTEKVNFIRDRVEAINLEEKTITLKSGNICTYNKLVIGLGNCSGYFGIEGAKEHTFSFRTRQDAIALKQQLHQCLQKASHLPDAQQRRHLLTIAIVGAGPSGVELAATLADLLPEWYRQYGGNGQEIRLLLINRGSTILEGDINSDLRQAAKTALTDKPISVELLLNTSVTKVQPGQLYYQSQQQTQTLDAATIVWTAGTKTHPLIQSLPIPDSHRDKKGRLLLAPTLQLPHFPDVFAGGDCGTILNHPLPPLGQVAHQQGTAIANNLQALADNKKPSHVEVDIKGSLLKLGLDEGAANLFEQYVLTGQSAHLIRQGRYLTLLPVPGHDFQATKEWLSEGVFSINL